MDYKSLCYQVVDLSKEVGKFIKEQRSTFTSDQVEVKSKNSLVSYVDKEAEKRLVIALGKLIPESGFIAEEGTSSKTGETYNWIIDPLDGTTNFIHGIPTYCVSIALKKGDDIVIGVVYEINLDECFYAWEGSEAFLNEKVINVSETKAMSESLVATGFPYHDYHRQSEFLGLLVHFMHDSRGIRRLGSAAVDLVYVACGRFECFYEYGLNAWDVAAGAFIVQRAGGNVVDFKGENDYIFGQEILATNHHLHKDFLKVVMDHFEK